jgi:hypothetical protein
MVRGRCIWQSFEMSFQPCTAYLWSIHDYLAYDKFVSWCVHGQLNYPICMDNTDAFRLEHGRKASFFDCHRRFLPSNHEFRNDTWSFLWLALRLLGT